MTTHYDVMRWQLLALAIGFFPGRALAAADLSANFSRARVLYEDRRYSEARAAFRELARDQPENIELNFYLGRLALWFDEETAALSYLERAVKDAPREARIYHALGDAYGLMAQRANLLLKLGWARKCLASYRHAVELEPKNVAYRWGLVGYGCAAPGIVGGGCELALAEAEEIGRLDPDNGRVARATVYLLKRDAPAAFALFDGVIAGVYAKRSGTGSDDWLQAMSDETWYTGPEAVAAKLADRLIGAQSAAAPAPKEVRPM
jgi:tetratricopeptide (TPR) repeat protein